MQAQAAAGGAKNSRAVPSGSRKARPEPYGASLIAPCAGFGHPGVDGARSAPCPWPCSAATGDPRVLAAGWAVVANMLTKIGSWDLTLLAADRAREAAYRSGDLADLGMTAYQVVCALLPTPRAGIGEDLATARSVRPTGCHRLYRCAVPGARRPCPRSRVSAIGVLNSANGFARALGYRPPGALVSGGAKE